jgi:Api92-like protein with ferredoxin domain
MPNWTSNIIRAEGPQAAIQSFLELVKGPEEIFDFDRIIPMPALLRHTGTGGIIVNGQRLTSFFMLDPQNPFPGPDNVRPFTEAELAELAVIGFSNWYDWAIHHWGTKWNSCHASLEHLIGEDGAVEIRFDTAWSAPFPIFHKLAALFPEIAFEFSWSDEDEPDTTLTLRIHHGAAS